MNISNISVLGSKYCIGFEIPTPASPNSDRCLQIGLTFWYLQITTSPNCLFASCLCKGRNGDRTLDVNLKLRLVCKARYHLSTKLPMVNWVKPDQNVKMTWRSWLRHLPCVLNYLHKATWKKNSKLTILNSWVWALAQWFLLATVWGL